MNINFIKSLLFVSAFVSMIACSDNDSDKRVNVEGSWISYYDNPEFWNLFTFENWRKGKEYLFYGQKI